MELRISYSGNEAPARLVPGDVLAIRDPKTGAVHTYVKVFGGPEAVAMETLDKAQQERVRAAIKHARATALNGGAPT